MQRPIPCKTLPVRNSSYFKTGGSSFAFFKQHPLVCDLFLIVFIGTLLFGFISYFHRFTQPLQATVIIDLSPLALPKYTFFR